jgi:hypothetical protein
MSEEQIKACSKCNQNLPFSQYFKDKNETLGISSQCKQCKNAATKLRRLKHIETEKAIIPDKWCSFCKLTKSSDDFTKLKSSKDGLSCYCKECRRLQDKRRIETAKQNPVNIDDILTKTCTTCLIMKPCSEYRVNRKSCDNFSHICVQCLPKNNWSREKQHIWEKNYRMNYPEKMKEKYKIQSQKINRRIRSRLNSRIAEALLTQNIRKCKNTVDYIGCSILFLRGWIESQFKENMTWENYGQWHLDHVKPCCSFDFSNPEEVKICFQWKNLQPLWAIDNLTKNGKIDTQLIEIQCEKANNYEKENNMNSILV